MSLPSEEPPRIGVVVPSFNQGQYLREALDSIFRQDYPALEVVVMDGGSRDDSVDIIRAYAPRLTHWQSAPDGGQAAAVNEGVTHCTGELVAWLNSDDLYWEDALWTVARAYAQRPGNGLYIGNGLRYRAGDGSYAPFSRRHVALDRKALAEGLDYVLQPATFFLRRAWEEVGGLRPELHFCMDWDVILRIAATRPAVLINEFLAASREYRETKTSRGKMERVFEIFRMLEERTGREATPGSVHYLIETLFQVTDEEWATDLRRHLLAGLLSIQEDFQRRFGNSDGFPEKGDAQDSVYLPTVAPGGPRRPSNPSAAALPAITLVTPSFNQARFLPQALDSVLEQGYPRLETLVFDAGSSDGSVDVLKRYGPRLTSWSSEPDRGPAHAINKGLAQAQGEVLGWLNSDDMLAEGALDAVGRAFANDPELDLVYGNALYVDEENRLHMADHGGYRTAFYYGAMQPVERIPAYWTYVHAVPQPTVFFRRRLLERCGNLNEAYHFIFDFELFYRFASKARIRKLERTMAFYRIHAASKTSDWGKFLVEQYRFSRPLWPPVLSPGFQTTWRGFVSHHLHRRYGSGLRDKRLWPRAALVSLLALTGLGNPEALP